MFQKQDIMRRMVYALTAVLIFSIIQYGWRVFVVAIVSLIFGVLTEYLFLRNTKKKVSEAVWVSSLIYALSLPPYVPFYLVPIGIVFAIAFGKMIFGGFGRNVVNPAISGRLLMYLTFPKAMTSGWVAPNLFGIDAVAGSTWLTAARNEAATGLAQSSWWQSFVGWTPGSIGEGSELLIALCAIYLILTGTAQWRLMLSTLIGFSLIALPVSLSGMQTLLVTPLSYWQQLTSGGIVFCAVFMVTDPVSAPKKIPSMWIYGALAGLIAVLIRYFSPGFPAGISFGLLVANLLAPAIDEWFSKSKAPQLKNYLKKKPAGGAVRGRA